MAIHRWDAIEREQLNPLVERQAIHSARMTMARLYLKAGAVVPVDTRDASAYGRARIPGAKHLDGTELETRLAELYMIADRPVLYCRSGDKTKELAARLAEQGVPVAFVEGGFLAWEAEGLPIERP